MDPLKFSLFISNWSSKEELMALEGLLKFGYGNWGSISEYISSNKGPWECEKHYKQIFLGKNKNTLSTLNILTYRDDNQNLITIQSDNTECFMEIAPDIIPIPEPRAEIEKHPLTEFAGYMPLRRDFEIEYENDIEMYLADLEFYDDDTAEDTSIKLRQLEVYNKVLEEREERKKFVIERWPQELKNEKRFSHNIIEKTIYQAMKPYARLLTPEKHLALVEALIKEYMLRLKLEELKEAKSLGIKTEEDFKKFIHDKKNNKAKEFDVLFKDFKPQPRGSPKRKLDDLKADQNSAMEIDETKKDESTEDIDYLKNEESKV